MSEFKGTKTEWHAVEFAGFIILKDSDFYEGKNILDYSDVGEVVANANAKLAKHSFELLEALEHTLEVLYKCDCPAELIETYGNLFMNYNNLISEIKS